MGGGSRELDHPPTGPLKGKKAPGRYTTNRTCVRSAGPVLRSAAVGAAPGHLAHHPCPTEVATSLTSSRSEVVGICPAIIPTIHAPFLSPKRVTVSARQSSVGEGYGWLAPMSWALAK